MLVPIDKSVPQYVNNAISTVEQLITSNQFKTFEKITRLSKGEFFALKILLLNNGESTPTEISTAMNSTKGRVSAVLNALEKKGEIERKIDKDNRRNIIVMITKAGKEHILSELMIGYRTMVHLFTELGEEDTKEFIRLAHKVVDLMNEC